jgi:RNA-directed DNA polymerase
MKKSKSYRKINKRSQAFLKIKTIADLSVLLEIETLQLSLMAIKPNYHLFSVRKKDGSPRWIEAPEADLKKVQRKINSYLQSVYFHIRTDAAYGFLINSKRDASPRNILTNAQRHLGCNWLFNADVEDFFHSIKSEAIFRIFTQAPFRFDDDLTDLLVRLTALNGRLPMGTPTSPTLSNFACLTLDKDLIELSKRNEWTYTRYADDMSFSSKREITGEMTKEIEQYCQIYSLHFNPEKFKLYGPKDEKEITGLIVNKDRVGLKPAFIQELEKDIQKLEDINTLIYQYKGQPSKWVDKFKQQIEGKINFVSYIKGERDISPQQLYRKYDNAQNPDIEFLAYSWDDFPYISPSSK